MYEYIFINIDLGSCYLLFLRFWDPLWLHVGPSFSDCLSIIQLWSLNCVCLKCADGFRDGLSLYRACLQCASADGTFFESMHRAETGAPCSGLKSLLVHVLPPVFTAHVFHVFLMCFPQMWILVWRLLAQMSRLLLGSIC